MTPSALMDGARSAEAGSSIARAAVRVREEQIDVEFRVRRTLFAGSGE